MSRDVRKPNSMQSSHSSNGIAFLRTLASSELADVVFEAAEVTLDSVLNEGLLRELPIIGSVANLARAGQHVAGEIFVRKLLRFLTEFKDVSAAQRAQLLEAYPDGSDKQNDLGENLLLALDRLDAVQKPALLARFFKAYVLGTIDYPTFTRIAQALDRFNLSLLPQLRWFYTREGAPEVPSDDVLHELSLAGLVTVSLGHSGTIGGAASYRQSPIGRRFIEIGFGVHPPP
jgi:hypothetical protein